MAFSATLMGDLEDDDLLYWEMFKRMDEIKADTRILCLTPTSRHTSQLETSSHVDTRMRAYGSSTRETIGASVFASKRTR